MIYEKVIRPYGENGTPRLKLVRVDGYLPPSRHPEHRRNYVSQVREECIELLGAVCVRCGYDEDIRALQIDHVHGGGHAERKQFSGGSSYLHIRNNIDSQKYQILCANCNMIKRAENRECPRPGRFNSFTNDPTTQRALNNMTCQDVDNVADDNGYFTLTGTYFSDDPEMDDDELYSLRKVNSI